MEKRLAGALKILCFVLVRLEGYSWLSLGPLRTTVSSHLEGNMSNIAFLFLVNVVNYMEAFCFSNTAMAILNR